VIEVPPLPNDLALLEVVDAGGVEARLDATSSAANLPVEVHDDLVTVLRRCPGRRCSRRQAICASRQGHPQLSPRQYSAGSRGYTWWAGGRACAPRLTPEGSTYRATPLAPPLTRGSASILGRPAQHVGCAKLDGPGRAATESYPLSRTLLKRARSPSALSGLERDRDGFSWAPASAWRSRLSPSPERPWRSQYRSQNARKRDGEKGSISRASNRTPNGIGSASTASSYPVASASTLPRPEERAPAASRRPVTGRRARAKLDLMVAQSAELKLHRSQSGGSSARGPSSTRPPIPLRRRGVRRLRGPRRL
jgi:hypothetical protein